MTTQLSTMNSTGEAPIVIAATSNPATVSPDLNSEEGIATPEVKKDRNYYKAQMKVRWNGAFKAIMAVAHLIVDARMNLSPQEWVTFVQEDCPFDYSALQKFMKMASHPALNAPENEQYLPSSWTALYEICQMKEETFRHGIQHGIIHPKCTLADIKELRKLDPAKRKPATKATTLPRTASQSNVVSAATTTAAKNEKEKSRVEKATVKARPNTLALHVVANNQPEPDEAKPNMLAVSEPSVSETCRVSIFVNQGLVERNGGAVKELKADIEALVTKYDFISAVNLEIAA